MAIRGRPTVRTPKIERRICAALAAGVGTMRACRDAGISRPTLTNWCDANPAFAAAVKAARDAYYASEMARLSAAIAQDRAA